MTRLGDLCDDVARAVAFLSRVPMPHRHFVGHDGRLSRAVRAFPLAGILITLPAALAAALLVFLQANALFATFLLVGVQVLVTGALHEDGLGDAADGLGGGRDRESALAIMKDSRVGTYGAVALILSFGLRVSALAAFLPLLSPIGAALALLGTAALSRTAMVWHWSRLPPARRDGVAASAGMPEPQATTTALVSGPVLALLMFFAAGIPFVAVLLAFAAFGLVVPVFGKIAARKLGGHTGDTIGATQQLAEIALFGALALAL
ncbi:adenosylcobinamide-GDP ribazoletransferase [Sinorhizobium alkalisoli]|uniref:Adenosylcobinamide-GDP ribazoletransferase n=1 Tax=Sinorhizobium alkalisoli TaxID=1752398 RepID=A0A1E3VCG9_9HYPH|nr:adenosylcobinamide-GDP ribazoletransferase [Sinorhizobium alkalisoli]MCA1494524.1 adenosylcobinamide-GDP ribazoletransferase [Ensifer sp. NBAIM29]MCG5480257.1 adenosylcobinamide-GDP ribazoletransferase [Sinorhizobium alkalisoli]ODR91279.1 adenosylcobinamide-GDP ribazoletransferase [Sinorhizobium alkalisoli]QFI66640.1 Cobalamin synthase [Sinorhizobium alkalisoli]